MADRTRDLLGMRFALQPVDTVTVGFDYSQSKDDYSKSAVGMTLGRRQALGADLAAQLGAASSAHASAEAPPTNVLRLSMSAVSSTTEFLSVQIEHAPGDTQTEEAAGPGPAGRRRR